MKNTENKERHSIEWYQARIAYLSGFMLPERAQKLRSVLEKRTRRMTICMENTFHSQNASALIRHCDAFGIQDIHTVESVCKFRPNVNIVKGTDKWIDLQRHRTTAEAITSLRSAGYRIVATTPHRGDCRPEDFDVTTGPFALVFGTEHAGISEEVMASADEFIRIPMCGFVESLNVSASAAIILYQLSERLRTTTENWALNDAEKAELLFRWMKSTVPNPEGILARYTPHPT